MGFLYKDFKNVLCPLFLFCRVRSSMCKGCARTLAREGRSFKGLPDCCMIFPREMWENEGSCLKMIEWKGMEENRRRELNGLSTVTAIITAFESGNAFVFLIHVRATQVKFPEFGHRKFRDFLEHWRCNQMTNVYNGKNKIRPKPETGENSMQSVQNRLNVDGFWMNAWWTLTLCRKWDRSRHRIRVWPLQLSTHTSPILHKHSAAQAI